MRSSSFVRINNTSIRSCLVRENHTYLPNSCYHYSILRLVPAMEPSLARSPVPANAQVGEVWPSPTKAFVFDTGG